MAGGQEGGQGGRTAVSRSWILRSSRARSASLSRPAARSASAAACAAGNAGVTRTVAWSGHGRPKHDMALSGRARIARRRHPAPCGAQRAKPEEGPPLALLLRSPPPGPPRGTEERRGLRRDDEGTWGDEELIGWTRRGGRVGADRRLEVLDPALEPAPLRLGEPPWRAIGVRGGLRGRQRRGHGRPKHDLPGFAGPLAEYRRPLLQEARLRSLQAIGIRGRGQGRRRGNGGQGKQAA